MCIHKVFAPEAADAGLVRRNDRSELWKRPIAKCYQRWRLRVPNLQLAEEAKKGGETAHLTR